MKALSPLEMIRKLVGFDTTSRESNLALIEFVREYLEGFGVKMRAGVRRDRARKANLYATIGPQDRPGIMLSGHTDVVPVDGQDWHSDPFKAVEKRRQALRPRRLRHEKLHRRGAGLGAGISGRQAQDADPSGA